MSFLKRIYNGPLESHSLEGPGGDNHGPTEGEVESHLQVDYYGDFRLTEAIRPSYQLDVVPQQGYRRDTYTDQKTDVEVPLLIAAASAEFVFDLFMDLLDPLGPLVDMVLETSHLSDAGEHADMYRDHIDLPVLKSTLWDYEELLTHDGCSGIAVLNPAAKLEVQFDEHKLLFIYGESPQQFEEILESHGVQHDPQLRFLTESDHIHSSSDEFRDQFDIFRCRTGAGS
jgi:hypothetical protein